MRVAISFSEVHVHAAAVELNGADASQLFICSLASCSSDADDLPQCGCFSLPLPASLQFVAVDSPQHLTLRLFTDPCNRCEYAFGGFTWSRTAQVNPDLLDETFSLTPTEKAIFLLVAQLRADDALLEIAESCKSQVDVTDQRKRITGIPTEVIVRAGSPQ